MIPKSKSNRLVLLAALSLTVFSLNTFADDTNTNTMDSASNGTNSFNATDADNSGKNVRDRNGAMRTPMDQGNSREDMHMTRQIRRAIMNQTNNFSMMAHNIKIITRDGQVTLRGPVKTDEEKLNILRITAQIAGTNNVSDLLEVKSNLQTDAQTNSPNQN
jgi:osmotically-inducible protein OsmY